MQPFDTNFDGTMQQRTDAEASEQPVSGEAAPQDTPVSGGDAQSETHEPQPEQPYRSATPYADSPYAVNPQSAPKKRKKSGKAWKGVIAAVLAVVLVVGSCAITAGVVNENWENRTAQMESSFNAKLNALEQEVQSNRSSGISVSGSALVNTDGGLTPAQVYAQNVRSVVAISNEATTNFYGQVSKTASSGSGFILSEDGYVVTNYHVVENATKLTVITYDSTEYIATLVGGDETNDVALLKIDAAGLPAVTLGSSGDLIVGDQVVAIGNPLGELTNSLTAGYVSALDRDVTTEGEVINMLQTDAAINPGNSGGPLFNMKGEVVGITTAKYSGTTSSGATIEGIGFAIPIDDVKSIISDLKEHGYVTGAYLGVTVSDVDETTAKRFNLPMGAYVESVTEGSCADKAGIQPKDTITALDGETVSSITTLTRALRSHKAGETVTVTVYRSGKELQLTATLDEKPRDTGAATPQESTPSSGSSGSYEDWYNQFVAPFFGQ